MKTRRRSVVRGAALSRVPAASLSFPASLIHPPQDQISRYGDTVSDRIVQLDHHAQHLGEGFGISFTNFVLNSTSAPRDDSALSISLTALAMFLSREERISLERRGGKWGLYFTRAPAVVGADQRAETLSIRDTPLDVRERFLLRSEEFFRAYLKLCEDRLGRMKLSVDAADNALRLLENVRLK